ncbi:MAG: DUF4118 domain-containing protein, partial [Pseudomonadota bacterium]|nr:DUF4118 domain-containing protein [Pseudomonadota bacterium]
MLRRLQPLRSLPLAAQYGATALIALAFFGLRYVLDGLGLNPERLPLLVLFLPAVVLSAFLFSRGSGYFAVVLCAALGLFFLVDPHQPLAGAGLAEAVPLAAFLAAGFIAAAVVQMLRRNVDHLAERAAELDEGRAELEASVARL